MEGGGLLVAHVQLKSNFYRALLLPLLLISDNPRILSQLPLPLILFFFLYFLCRSLLALGGIEYVVKLSFHGFFLGSGIVNGFTGGEASSCLWSS